MDLNLFLKEAETSKEFKNKYIEILLEYLSYNSTGMHSCVVDILEIFEKRLLNNDKIIYEKTNDILDLHTFKHLVYDNFGEFIYEIIFKTKIN